MGKRRRFLRFFSISYDPFPPPSPTRLAAAAVCDVLGLPVTEGRSPPRLDTHPKSNIVAAPGGSGCSGNTNPALVFAIQKHIDELSGEELETFRNGSKLLSEYDLLERVRELDNKHRETSSFRPQAERITRFLKFFEQFIGGAGIVYKPTQKYPPTSLAVSGS
ncbi:hypothetical protein AJ79_07901 [Helicocarpus griseus UAMH5409]|uniref:Uncharacterized protein n=1 Tax=Helicocarpus griseus UAMH5409 TaxID=1447875 RepID=A0A2B7WY26_9EURO|nr:hypothetical protein AJ79_07901 [Helicocarpus griseus UAMH5409]